MTQKTDILKALQRARQMLDKRGLMPAIFKLFPADIPLFQSRICDLTHVKVEKKGGFEYQGIKIVEDEAVPVGFVYVCNSDGRILQRYEFN